MATIIDTDTLTTDQRHASNPQSPLTGPWWRWEAKREAAKADRTATCMTYIKSFRKGRAMAWADAARALDETNSFPAVNRRLGANLSAMLEDAGENALRKLTARGYEAGTEQILSIIGGAAQ